MDRRHRIIEETYLKAVNEMPELADQWRDFMRSILSDLEDIGEGEHFPETIQGIADSLKEMQHELMLRCASISVH